MESIGIPARVPLPLENGRSFEVRVERTAWRDRLLHEGALLFLGVVVLGLSFAFPTLKSQGMWLSFPCVFYKVTGLPCLTCGLTRSFAFTAHGRFSDAFGMHLLGPILFMGVAAFTAYLSASLLTGRRIRIHVSPRARRIVFWCFLGILLACWVLKIAFMRGSW